MWANICCRSSEGQIKMTKNQKNQSKMISPAGARAAWSAWLACWTPWWWWWWSPWWMWTSPSDWQWCWTAVWWRMESPRQAARCPGSWCWDRPRQPCWTPSGHYSRGLKAGPGRTDSGPAPILQSVSWFGCWRLWAGALQENNVTYIQRCLTVDSATFTEQEKRQKDRLFARWLMRPINYRL